MIWNPTGWSPFLVVLLVLPWRVSADPVRPAARELFGEALEYRKANDMDRAMDSLLRSYYLDPAVVSLNDGGLIPAILRHLNQRLERTPGDAILTFKIAELLNLSGRPGSAIRFYEKVVKLQPVGHLARTAQLEADQLRPLVLAPEPVRSPDHGASPDSGGSVTAALTEEFEGKLRNLQDQLDRQKSAYTELEEQKKKVQEELAKLQKDYADLQAQSTRYKSWQNLYFSGQGPLGGSP